MMASASTLKHHKLRARRLFSLAERSLSHASRRSRNGLTVHTLLNRAAKLQRLASAELKRCRHE
jgi:hypothetical protein